MHNQSELFVNGIIMKNPYKRAIVRRFFPFHGTNNAHQSVRQMFYWPIHTCTNKSDSFVILTRQTLSTTKVVFVCFISKLNHIIGNEMSAWTWMSANVWFQIKQIWVIFTHLKLWVAVARNHFKWMKIIIKITWRFNPYPAIFIF